MTDTFLNSIWFVIVLIIKIAIIKLNLPIPNDFETLSLILKIIFGTIIGTIFTGYIIYKNISKK